MRWSNAAVAMSAQCLVLPECGPLAEVGSLRIPVHWRDGSYGILDWISASVGLDVGRSNHLAPLLGLCGNVLAEIGGRARKHPEAQIVILRLNVGPSESSIDLPVE